MIAVHFKAPFIRKMHALDERLQEEVIEKIDLFRNPENHRQLRVHKLHGELTGFYSFSISYKIRIVFQYLSKTEVALLSIGDHDIYN